MEMIAVANIGNTNTAVGLWAGSWQWVERIPTADIAGSDGFLQQLAQRRGQAAPLAGITKAAVATVVPGQTAAVVQALQSHTGRAPLCVARGQDVPLDTAVYTGSLLGADRAVCCYAALQKAPAPLVVFDVGTALSVSAVGADGRFAGGAILPGLHLGLRVLASETAQLPAAGLEGDVPLLGTSTEQCLAAGALYGLAGAIDGYAQRLEALWGRPVATWLTGGGAAVLAPYLAHPHRLAPTLLLDGLVALCHTI